jgi:hypothetical protein
LHKEAMTDAMMPITHVSRNFVVEILESPKQTLA